MNHASATDSGAQRTISGRGQLLLAGLLAVSFAAIVLALSLAVIKPAATLAVAHNPEPVAVVQSPDTRNEPRLAQNSVTGSDLPQVRAGEDTLSVEWLGQRNAASADRAAAKPQDDTLSAEWLVQRNAVRAESVGDPQHPAGQNPLLLIQSSTPVTPYWSDSGLMIP